MSELRKNIKQLFENFGQMDLYSPNNGEHAGHYDYDVEEASFPDPSETLPEDVEELTHDKLQNNLLSIIHHVEDALEDIPEDSAVAVASLKDIIEIANELSEFLPEEFRNEFETMEQVDACCGENCETEDPHKSIVTSGETTRFDDMRSDDTV